MSETDETFTREQEFRNPNLTYERVLAVLQNVGANRKAACLQLKTSRTTLWRFIEANPKLKDEIWDIEEDLGDLAEGQIVTAIKAGDMQTVRWYADRKLRHRGYGHQTVALTGPDGGPIQVEHDVVFDWSSLPLETLEVISDACAAAFPDEE